MWSHKDEKLPEEREGRQTEQEDERIEEELRGAELKADHEVTDWHEDKHLAHQIRDLNYGCTACTNKATSDQSTAALAAD